MTDELEAIHKRHEADDKVRQYIGFLDAPTALWAARQSHADRATLLRALDAMAKENARLAGLIRVLLENEPHDAVSDGGHTVLDLWRHDARAALNQETKP